MQTLLALTTMGCIGLTALVIIQAKRIHDIKTTVDRITEDSGFFRRPHG